MQLTQLQEEQEVLEVQNEFLPVDRLYFSTFTFTAEVTEDIITPGFKGSVFHGGFGNAFRKLVCVNPKETVCGRCLLSGNCSYIKVFETTVSDEVKRLLQITASAPHPYIIEPPDTLQRKYKKGELLTFNLILAGRAEEYLPYFILVFIRLGSEYGLGLKQNSQRGKYRLLNIRNNSKVIYSSENNELQLPVERINTISQNGKEVTRVKLNFVTPTRLEVNHRPQMLDMKSGFTMFILRLYSRLYRLQELYCSDSINPYSHFELERLSRQVKTVYTSLSWYDLERIKKTYTEEEIIKQNMKYGGFVGEVIFEGNLTPFVEMLRIGEYLHVGKYYTFGLGKYEILSIS